MNTPNLRLGCFQTPDGPLHVLTERDPRGSERPGIVVLHGALRHSENTSVWAPILSDIADVVLVDLPGHGRTPGEGTPTLQAFTARVRALIPVLFAGRKVVIVGESVGGLVALALGDGRTPEVAGVLVSDPPMTTAKLWPVFNNFLRPTSGPLSDFMKAFYLATFGYFARGEGGGITGDRIYYALVAGVKVRTLILTGDLPLFPVRPMPNNVPCLLDEVDKMVIRSLRNPHVSLETIAGAGHLCLDPAHDQVRQAMVKFCTAELGTEPAQERATAV